MSIAQSNVTTLPVKSVKATAIATAIGKSDNALASLMTASSAFGSKLSDFTKSYAKVYGVFYTDEAALLKKAKTPAEVKTVKQARYDGEVAFRNATLEQLKGLVDNEVIKHKSVLRSMQRAVQAHVATIKGYVKATSQAEKAQAMAKARGAKQAEKATPKKAAPTKENKPTLAGAKREITETMAALYDNVSKAFTEPQIKRYQELQAAFLHNVAMIK